jgi:hypothetical protein
MDTSCQFQAPAALPPRKKFPVPIVYRRLGGASLDAIEKRRLQIFMMGTEIVTETSAIFNQLTQLTAPEDFIKRKASFLLLRRLNADSWVTHSVAEFICGDGSKVYRNLQRRFLLYL